MRVAGFSEEENEESLGRWSNGKKSIFVLTVHLPFSWQQNFDTFSRSFFFLAAGHEEDLIFSRRRREIAEKRREEKTVGTLLLHSPFTAVCCRSR